MFKKVGVFGLGKSGKAAVDLLRNQATEIVAYDDNEAARAVIEEGAKVHILEVEKWNWPELEALILAPGVPLTFPSPHRVVKLARERNIPILCDVELLYRMRQPQSRFIGITGTNGKSTTTALIGHVLQSLGVPSAVGGNIGYAAATLPHDRALTYVLEMSSYQLELLEQTTFDISVLLNVTPDHLDRHGDMAGYVAAKCHIFDHHTAQSVAIIGVDSAPTKAVYDAMKETYVGTLIPISIHSGTIHGGAKTGVWYEQDTIHYDFSDRSGRKYQGSQEDPHASSLAGPHNRQNMLAAFAVALVSGFAAEKIIATLPSFKALPHRMQEVAAIEGLRFIDDSKATNVESAKYALQSFPSIYWIAGGKAKDGDAIEQLLPYLPPQSPQVKAAFFIGSAAESYQASLANYLPCEVSGTIQKAVQSATKRALADMKKGEQAVVLLSPCCASFDQFKNYEDRGNQFAEAARQVIAEPSLLSKAI